MVGWVAGEIENKAIFQLEVVVEVEVEVGAWQQYNLYKGCEGMSFYSPCKS